MASDTMQPYLDQLYEQCLSLIQKPEALDEVNEKLDLIIKVDVEYAPAYYLQGFITFLNDDLDEAIEPWEIALSLEYKIKEVALGLSIIHLKNRNLQSLKETLKIVRSIMPQDDLYKEIFDELIKNEEADPSLLITMYKRIELRNLLNLSNNEDLLQTPQILNFNDIKNKIKSLIIKSLKNKNYPYYIIIISVVLFSSQKLLESGMPRGVDIYAHLFWVWNFWSSFLKLSYPVWCTYWYGGYPMMLTYGPFSHILSAIISIFTNNYILGTKLTFIFSFILGAIGIYLICLEYEYDKKAALVASLSYPLSYHYILQASLRGSLSNCVSMGFLPIFYLFLIRYYNSVDKNKSKKIIYKNMVLSSLFLMMVFLSHLSIGVMAIMISALYVFYNMIYDLAIKKSNSVMKYGSSYLIIILLFLLFSSFWAIPMFSYAGFNRAAGELIPKDIQSGSLFLDWVSYFPSFLSDILTRNFGWYPWYMGISLIFCSIIASITSIKKYPKNFLPLLFLFSLFSASGGLPLISNLFGINLSILLSNFRLLAIVVLSVSILTGHFTNELFGFVSRYTKNIKLYKNVSLIITFLMIVAIYVDFSPGLTNFRNTEITDQLTQEFQWLEQKEGLFRVYSHGVYQIQGSMERLGPVIHGKELLHGNDENSIPYEMYRNVEETNWMVKNAKDDPVLAERLVDGITKKFTFGNVKYFVVGPGIQEITPILDSESDFIRHRLSDTMDIYEMNEPITPVVEVSRVLVIGEEGSTQVVHNHFFYCPQNFVYDIESDYDSIDLEKLTKYDLIVLYGIPQVDTFTQLEPTINEYIKNGGLALIDPSPLKTDITFLGVTGSFENLQADVEVAINPDYHSVLQGEDDYSFSKAQYYDIPWGFHTYQDLDEEIASINQYTLLGYRNIGEGRAYYLGFNLFFHIEYTKNEDERQFLNNVIEYLLEPDEVSISDIQRSTGQLSFTAEISDQSTDLLISESYFPGWRILDNQHKIDYEQTRDGWILITLENGTHTISLKRFITLPYILGFATTTLTIIIIILNYYREFKPDTFNRYLRRK